MRRDHGSRDRRTDALRRRTLLATGSVLTAALAGCGGLGGSDTPDQPFATLDRRRVYVDDGVDLSVPESVSTGSEPADAGVVVIPGDTERSPILTAEWIADGSSVALLGDGCGSTWNSWVMTSAYATNFDVMGAEWGNPGADLVVGAAIGLNLVTYGRTWEDTPSDRDVLRALEEIAADIERRTGDN